MKFHFTFVLRFLVQFFCLFCFVLSYFDIVLAFVFVSGLLFWQFFGLALVFFSPVVSGRLFKMSERQNLGKGMKDVPGSVSWFSDKTKKVLQLLWPFSPAAPSGYSHTCYIHFVLGWWPQSCASLSTLAPNPACCLRLKAEKQKKAEGWNLEQIEQEYPYAKWAAHCKTVFESLTKAALPHLRVNLSPLSRRSLN